MIIMLVFALHHRAKITQTFWDQRCVSLLAQCAM